jgi:hypothetical protein
MLAKITHDTKNVEEIVVVIALLAFLLAGGGTPEVPDTVPGSEGGFVASAGGN